MFNLAHLDSVYDARARVVRLLEIVWLILFLPALCLWFQRPSRLRFVPFFTLTVCGLILLYPFISASDDLLAVAQAFEEPAIGKRIVAECSRLVHQTCSVSAIAISSAEISFSFRLYLQPTADQLKAFVTALCALSGRSPPFYA